MILRQVHKNVWFFFVLFLLFITFSALTLDYSGLKNFSISNALNILQGLGSPDWTFVFDGSGEDLISLIVLTIAIAFLGTFLATILALPLTLLSAANLWSSHLWISRFGKILCNSLRAFPELVFTIIFVKIVGPGPFAGVLAISVHQIGMLGKLFTEELEAMDKRLIEEVEAVGANLWQNIFFVRIPYLLPIYSSFALNHFEIAVRSAATLGLVGAGGIGASLIFAIQTRTWSKVSIILLGVVITVFILDQITGIIRRKLK